MENNKVEIIWNHTVEAFIGGQTLEALTLRDVALDDKRDLHVSGCFVAAGSQPNNELFISQLHADAQGMLIAGADTRTHIPKVYVAGDIRAGALRQIVSAAADGAMAAVLAGRD